MASKSIDHHRCYTYVLYKISLDIYIYTVTPSQKKGIEKPWLFLSNHFESCPPSILLGFRRSSVSWTILGTSRCCQMREAASDSMVGFPKLYICMKWTLWTFTIQEIWLWLKTWRQLRSASMSTAQSQRWRLDSKKAHLGMGCWFCWWKIFNSKKIWRFFKIIFFDVYFEFPRLMIVNLNWKKPFRHFDAFDPLLTVFLLAIFCTSPWVDRTFQNPKAINVQLSARVMQNYNDFVSGMQMARSLAYLITNPTRTSRKKQGSLRSTPPSHASRSGFLRIRY